MNIVKSCHVAVAALLVSTAPVLAQDNQEGLVNVDVEGNTVQVPVSVAANVCDIDVDVLSADFVGSDETACSIDQQTAATNDFPGYEDDPGQGGGNQTGLVNVDVEGNTVQVPIGVAAQVCDLDANVLARDFAGTEDTACSIDQETAAANNFPTLEGAEGSDTTIDTATETVEGAAEAVEATADDAAEAAGDVAEGAADAASDAAEDAADTLDDAVGGDGG